MRKLFLFLLILSILLIPSIAQAQNNIVIKELNIQLWAEYDRPEMLVMYSIALADDTPLPASIDVRIPADADLHAVAKLAENSLINVPYDTPIRDGDMQIITLVIDELTSYRVEYYEPIEKDNSTRNFSFLWQNNNDIDTLFVEFQQPPSAKNLVTQPALPSANPVAEGMVYHTLTQSNLSAGEEFSLEISYDKDNDDLTVSSMPVEVGGAPESDPASSSLSDSLPLILVSVGVLLVVGGFLYFFLTGRKSKENYQSRKRHAPKAASAGGDIYCHECGGRAHKGDRFCRACGVKLRL